jgi:putative lipoprotein
MTAFLKLAVAAFALSTMINPAAAIASPAGRWLAEDIRGGGVIDNLQSVLEIAEDGAISGTGGCNRMAGKATISGETIAFGAIAATRMACAPAAMDQETKFFAALNDAKSWRIDEQGKLTLLDASGGALVILSPM